MSSSLIPYHHRHHHQRFSSKSHRSIMDPRGSFGQNALVPFTRRRVAPNFNKMAIRTMQKLFRQNQWNQHYLRRTRRKQIDFWTNTTNTMPFPMHTSLALTTPNMVEPPTVYQVEQELHYIPFPVQLPTSQNRFGLQETTIFGHDLASLPPKIRIIFIPTQPEIPCLPSVMSQPIYIGPLTMPPFFFNRMSSCMNYSALPAPPPLPQINSLPLSPAIQSMVMQRYSNPSAVIPLMPSLPGFPSFDQSPMPISAFQSYSPPAAALPQQQQQQQPCPCRACPPAPPMLNIPVKDYSWVQHCSACGGMTNASQQTNERPADGRITPLRSLSTQNSKLLPIGTSDINRYPHVNPSAKERPWLHELPPLPPGAVVISDEIFINSEDTPVKRISRLKKRPIRRSKAQIFSPSRVVRLEPMQSPMRIVDDVEDRSSSDSTSNNEAIGFQRTVRKSSPKRTDFARQQLSTSAKKLNLRYNYLPHDIASVYQKNAYAKSNSGDSLSSTDLSEISIKRRSLLIKEYNRQRPPPPPRNLNSIAEENLRSFTPCSLRSNKSQKKSIVIREYSMKSPSTKSRMSVDSELFIVVKESTQSVAMVSVLRAEKDKFVLHETISMKNLQLSD